MKKSLGIIILISVFCIGLFSGCASESNKGSETFEVQLAGNPSTGYEWTYSMDKEGVVKEDSADYTQDKTDENMVGAGGTYTFVFSGVAEGDVTLTFAYARSWEEAQPEQTEVYKLHVDAAGNITQQQ